MLEGDLRPRFARWQAFERPAVAELPLAARPHFPHRYRHHRAEGFAPIERRSLVRPPLKWRPK